MSTAQPASKVFGRSCHAQLPTAVGGDGAFLIDANGKRTLDACGGAAVSCLGHSCEPVIAAAQAQLGQLAYAHTSFFTSEPAEALAAKLSAAAPGDLDMVYFVSGGSEAVEAAIKLARQYHYERGDKERRHVIARWQSYHGNTLGALSAGGNRWRRQQFEPLLVGAMHHVSPCHHWRWSAPDETPDAYGARLVAELEAHITELGAETVAAVLVEPVVGATMGAVPPVPGYLAGLREVCDRHGVLLIFDEVMCGMGRTGHLFACDEDGVAPDLLCIAKGLGAGIQPIGAMLATAHIFKTIADGSGFFQHGHTYLAHPVACAAGLAVLEQMEQRDLISNVRARGAQLRAALEERFGQHPNVGDIRGRGLFLGLELVADRETKAPFDPALNLNGQIKRAAMAAGLMVYPGGGTVDGRNGDHIMLAPPFIIDDTHIGMIVDRLEGAMTESLASIRAAA